MSRAMLARKAEAVAPATKTKAASTGLRIGEVNDSFEREADRVADAVMAGTQNWSLSGISSGAPVQRKCECGASAGSGGQCEERKKKEGTVQRRAVGMSALSAAPPSVYDTLGSSGQPLDASTRSFMEPRFGHDFGKVRIHADSKAAASAREIQSLAFTVGDHIAFASGQYQPHGHEGRKLLTHELVHTIQQRAKPATRPLVQRKVILKGAEMPEKDREAFLKSHSWAGPGTPRQVMYEMAVAGDPFDFADENELQREIVKRVSTARHMEESQTVQGPHSAAFGYPFTNESLLYGPRVNYTAREYWEPAVVDNYVVRTDAKKNKQLAAKPRSERCTIYGDPCGIYAWNLSAKGKADPYKAIVLLFTPQPPHKRSLIHCDYLVSLVLFRSFADAVGIAEFNKRVIAYGVNKIQLRWNAFYDLQDAFWGPAGNPTEKGLGEYQYVRPSSEEDLVIGDHVVFFNRAGYPIINQRIGNAWQLENAVLVSKDSKRHGTFLGHGSGHLTDPGMRTKLADEYNKVAQIALDIVTRAKSKDPKTKSKAMAEMDDRFKGIQLVVGKWMIQGKGLQQVNVNEELKRIGPSEVAGLKDPANLSQMFNVRRPIESKK
jgi:hypothetical protein